jgi:SAM-dependent methyltransferase
MLKDAALLQLELLVAGSADAITLKDATPFNIQWNGVKPVFIDVTSFVRSRVGTPWAGYRQFCRMFLFPLMLQAYKDVAFHPQLRGRLEGIEAAECRHLMSWRDLLRPGILTHVIAQSHLERQNGTSARDIRGELHQAGFDTRIAAATVARLQKLVRRLTWSPPASTWSEYADHNSYEPDAALAKERFVESVLRVKGRRLVWDLGCNTGRFSKLAGRHADYVIAVDSDHASIERLYQELTHAGTPNVLPLVGDVADPSPALGWRGRERLPMLERGRPDLVLCLALVHHLAITANIPVADLVDWFAEIGGELVIEFPLPDDPMVKRLLLNKDQRYDDYCAEYFETSLQRRFRIRERLTLPSGTRILYHAIPLT